MSDVVTFLKSQHLEIKARFERVLKSNGAERERLWVQLKELMLAHETAEQRVVHPRSRRNLENGNEIVEKHLKEEQAGERLINSLDKLNVDSAEFQEKIQTLQRAVLEHAESEERSEFDPLAAQVDAHTLDAMADRVKAVEAEKTNERRGSPASRM